MNVEVAVPVSIYVNDVARHATNKMSYIRVTIGVATKCIDTLFYHWTNDNYFTVNM